MAGPPLSPDNGNWMAQNGPLVLIVVTVLSLVFNGVINWSRSLDDERNEAHLREVERGHRELRAILEGPHRPK